MSSAVTLNQIVDQFGGRLQGDSLEITGVGTLQSAKQGDIVFVESEKYLTLLESTTASAVIIPAKMAAMTTKPAIVTDNPKLVFARVSRLLNPKRKHAKGVHPTAVVDESVQLGKNISIGPFCVIEANAVIEDDAIIESHCHIGIGCVVGRSTHLHARVTLYSNVQFGIGCECHSGTVIGADGFGYANDKGQWVKVPQIGGVRIGNHVEIGANTTIDSGALEPTMIDDGVILDNLIQIGHNVKIGKGTAMSAQVGIAGSTEIGNYCMVGGSSIINGHIKIADGTIFIPGAQVANTIKKPEVFASAIPARPRSQWARNTARFHHLDDMAKKLSKLQRQVNQLGQDAKESSS